MGSFAALSGVLFVLCFVAGFALQDTGPSTSGATPAEVVSSYSDDDTELRTELGAAVVGFVVFFPLVFVGSLHRSLRRAEGENRLFSSSSFAGGIVVAGFLGASAAIDNGRRLGGGLLRRLRGGREHSTCVLDTVALGIRPSARRRCRAHRQRLARGLEDRALPEVA